MEQSRLDATVRQIMMFVGTILMMVNPEIFTDTITSTGTELAITITGVVLEVVAFIGTLRSRIQLGAKSVASWVKAASNFVQMK